MARNSSRECDWIYFLCLIHFLIFFQQIFKDSQSIHNIFFNISIGQRMAIIRQDREIRQERSLRGEDPDPPKRISAVTKARMQQKTQIQAMLIQSEAAVHQSNRCLKFLVN